MCSSVRYGPPADDSVTYCIQRKYEYSKLFLTSVILGKVVEKGRVAVDIDGRLKGGIDTTCGPPRQGVKMTLLDMRIIRARLCCLN